MIKYDYTLWRKEGQHERSFGPEEIDQELPDVVYIEGPNSIGKSTLLNIIALGFFGNHLESSRIDTSLKRKIENLLSKDHQRIKFNIEINNEKLGIKLKSVKEDFESHDITVSKIINGKEKPIPINELNKEFKLIYDIPSDPLDRLKYLLKEIQGSIRNRGMMIDRLSHLIRESIRGVKEGKDPKYLKELKDKVERENKDYEENKQKIEHKREELDLLKKYLITKYYLEYSKKFEELDDRRKKLESERRKTKRKEKKKSKNQSEYLKKIKIHRESAVSLYNSLSTQLKIILPKEEAYRIDIWENADIYDEIKEPENHKTLRQEISYYLNFIDEEKLNLKEDKSTTKVSFLERFKALLEDFKTADLTLPGTEKSINEFISIIDDELLANEKIINKRNNLNETERTLKRLKEDLNQAIKYTERYKESVEENEELKEIIQEQSESQELDNLRKELKNLEEKKKFYKKELNKLDIEESNTKEVFKKLNKMSELETFQDYTEDQLIEAVNARKSNINSLEQTKGQLERSIRLALDEIKRLENKEPHKYQNYLKELEELRDVVQELGQKISVDFLNYLEDMENGKEPKSKESEYHKFTFKVSEYLARKLKTIKHIDKSYELKRIDILNGKIYTLDERVFDFDDLGTGQSQKAYIEGLLSMDEDKKLIALFDEVGMMDSETMQPILERLRQLYEEKKLLLGIVVQRKDGSVNIREIV